MRKSGIGIIVGIIISILLTYQNCSKNKFSSLPSSATTVTADSASDIIPPDNMGDNSFEKKTCPYEGNPTQPNLIGGTTALFLSIKDPYTRECEGAELRTCNAETGILSGSYKESSCTNTVNYKGDSTSCHLADGLTLEHSAKMFLFPNSTQCRANLVICESGSIKNYNPDGTFFRYCNTDPAPITTGACQWEGKTISNHSKIIGFKQAKVNELHNEYCTPSIDFCNNGIFARKLFSSCRSYNINDPEMPEDSMVIHHIFNNSEVSIQYKPKISLTAFNCHIEYSTNGINWTTFSSEIAKCSNSTSLSAGFKYLNLNLSLKSIISVNNPWGSFKTDSDQILKGIRLRIVYTNGSESNERPLLECIAHKKGSTTNTPNSDENCNGNWDEL